MRCICFLPEIKAVCEKMHLKILSSMQGSLRYFLRLLRFFIKIIKSLLNYYYISGDVLSQKTRLADSCILQAPVGILSATFNSEHALLEALITLSPPQRPRRLTAQDGGGREQGRSPAPYRGPPPHRGTRRAQVWPRPTANAALPLASSAADRRRWPRPLGASRLQPSPRRAPLGSQ